ncbi:MAG: PQQ-dependent sugar dehydrogenase, partial [Burkholderiales bacterium]
MHTRLARWAILSGAAFALAALPAAAQTITTQEHAFRIVKVVEGLEHPWGLAFLPDGRMLVTERPGRLRVVGQDGRLDPQAVSGLPQIAAHGQGGLMDVALHPRFAENHLVYLSYAARGEG